jgi:hypothetical protein
MDSVLPHTKPYIPRVGHRVTVVVGEPIPVAETLRQMASASTEDRRKAVMAIIRERMMRLSKEAEIYHAKFTAKLE